MLLVVYCYAAIAPILLPVACLLYLGSYLVYKNQALYVYVQTAESGGAVSDMFCFFVMNMIQQLFLPTLHVQFLLMFLSLASNVYLLFSFSIDCFVFWRCFCSRSAWAVDMYYVPVTSCLAVSCLVSSCLKVG